MAPGIGDAAHGIKLGFDRRRPVVLQHRRTAGDVAVLPVRSDETGGLLLPLRWFTAACAAGAVVSLALRKRA